MLHSQVEKVFDSLFDLFDVVIYTLELFSERGGEGRGEERKERAGRERRREKGEMGKGEEKRERREGEGRGE